MLPLGSAASPQINLPTPQTAYSRSHAIPLLPPCADHPRQFDFNPSASRGHRVPYPHPMPATRTVKLAWKGSPSTEVVGYKIFWGTGSYNYQNVRDVKNALTASLALPKNNEYYVAVNAYSMTTSSWFSNEVIVPASSGP